MNNTEEKIKEQENKYVEFVVNFAKQMGVLKEDSQEVPLWGKLVKEDGNWKLMYGLSPHIHE